MRAPGRFRAIAAEDCGRTHGFGGFQLKDEPRRWQSRLIKSRQQFPDPWFYLGNFGRKKVPRREIIVINLSLQRKRTFARMIPRHVHARTLNDNTCFMGGRARRTRMVQKSLTAAQGAVKDR